MKAPHLFAGSVVALLMLFGSSSFSRNPPDCLLYTSDVLTLDHPRDEGECDGIAARTLTYSPAAYSAAAFSSELNQLREAMLANPACRVVVTGTGGGSKIEQQMSWLRVDAIITYMNDTHDIARNRFIFQAGQPGDANTVTIRPAGEGEDGPSSAPQPHPGLIR